MVDYRLCYAVRSDIFRSDAPLRWSRTIRKSKQAFSHAHRELEYLVVCRICEPCIQFPKSPGLAFGCCDDVYSF